MSETVLDVQGLSCPLPVLKANKALRGLPPGARLTVLATDPASVKDFQAYARETGHVLVGFSEGAGLFRFTLRKRDELPAASPAARDDGEPAPSGSPAAGRKATEGANRNAGTAAAAKETGDAVPGKGSSTAPGRTGPAGSSPAEPPANKAATGSRTRDPS